MKNAVIPIIIPPQRSRYDITVGAELLSNAGTWAAKCLRADSGRVLIVSNPKVFGLYGDRVSRSFAEAGFSTREHLIGDGERFKNFRTLEKTLNALSELGFARTDTVVALGGGVVGDLAGFAASVYLRGIPFLQIPTTLLAMIDSSVGGKTGVNSSFGKNLVGSFYQPRGVLIDVDVLNTLDTREITAGFCEAIKQGAISGKPLFDQTDKFLKAYRATDLQSHFDGQSFRADLVQFLAAQIAFKASIVQNDAAESPANQSKSSRKILNFGHTLAHALEKVTEYKYLRHGEAVGYGILFAAELSKRVEFLGHDEVDLLNDVVRRAGVLPAISHIDPSEVSRAFKHDKKQVGDSLQWILLRGIGKPVIVPDTEIPKSAITSTLKSLFAS